VYIEIIRRQIIQGVDQSEAYGLARGQLRSRTAPLRRTEEENLDVPCSKCERKGRYALLDGNGK